MYLVILLAYALAISLVGFLRLGNNTEAFFFAERKLGAVWICATLTASWIGAASTLITIREAAARGYSALWVMAVPTLVTLAVFFLITGTIRKRKFTTLPQLLQRTYGRAVTSMAAWLIFVYMILLTSSQLVAWGKLLSSMLSMSYAVAVTTAILLIALYSTAGGFFSVVFTDGLQLLFLGTGLVLLYLFVGRGAPLELPPPGAAIFLQDLSQYYLLVVSFTFAWVISPIVWQRVAAANNSRSARRGILLSAILIAGLYLLVIPIGIALGNDISQPDEIFRILISRLPLWAGGVVFLGFASAILSTADTALNLAAMTFSLDMIPVRFSSASGAVKPARWGTLLSAAMAAIIAIRIPSILKTLGLASEIMAEGLFIPGMYALFFKKPSPRAGILAMTLGGGFALASFMNSFGFPLRLPEWPESLPWGIGLSLTGFLMGMRLDARKSRLMPRQD